MHIYNTSIKIPISIWYHIIFKCRMHACTYMYIKGHPFCDFESKRTWIAFSIEIWIKLFSNTLFGTCIYLWNTVDANHVLIEACDVARPRRYTSERRNPYNCRNKRIDLLRKDCLKAKRKVQRSRGKSRFESRIYSVTRRKRQIFIRKHWHLGPFGI